MSTRTPSHRPTMSTRAFAVAALLVCLVLAGGVSYYASDDPDGLNKVAIDKGLADQERESGAADSPLAGYSTGDINDDRLSGGLAGAAGVGVVLLLAGSLAYVVRRRTADSDG